MREIILEVITLTVGKAVTLVNLKVAVSEVMESAMLMNSKEVKAATDDLKSVVVDQN